MINEERYSREELELLADARNSTELFGRLFMPHHFPRVFTGVHREIFRVLDDDSIKRAVIVAPRGIGKTTLISNTYPLKRMLYRDSRFIIMMGASADTAMEQTENMKAELASNDRIRAVFGKAVSDNVSKEEWNVWFHDDPVGAKVLPRGAGQKVRGRKYRQYRPDLILVDDLENDKNIKSELMREDVKRWFFSSLLNLTDVYGDTGRIIVVGTIMHQDSLLSNLLDLPDWHKVVLSLADDNMKSNIPEWYSDEQVIELRESLRRANELDKFYMEFMSTVTSGEDGLFRASYFTYYDEEELRGRLLETVVLADPARTTGARSADSAIMAVTLDSERDRLYVRDVFAGKISPDECIRAMLDMADTYNASVLAPEVTGLEEFFLYPLREEMLKRYKRPRYEILPLKPIRSKEDRARALVPWYKRGAVSHRKEACVGLEKALLSYPRCARWDVLDCLSNMISAMDEGDRFIGFGGVDSSNGDVTKDELAALAALEKDDEKLYDLGDSWKRIR